MTRSEWLLARQQIIGASDAPDIVGLGFNDALKVYQQKTGEPRSATKMADLLRLGLELEPVIKARYQEMKGVDLEENGFNIYLHPERQWQGCTPDFKRPDGIFVQAKTVGFFDEEWGESGSDEIPDDYRIQVIQEMGVTGTPIIEVAALARMSGEFRAYRVSFCVDTWVWLTEIEAEFWGHVQSRTPLPDNWMDRFGDAPVLSREFVSGKKIDLGSSVAAMIDQRKAIGDVRKQAEDAYEDLTKQLKVMLGDAESAFAGEWELTRTTVKPFAGFVEKKGYQKLNIKKRKLTPDSICANVFGTIILVGLSRRSWSKSSSSRQRSPRYT